ncbi:TIGR04282 family arsenosugar biosynthesis glycosyltransferase [Actinoplanes siamensis]
MVQLLVMAKAPLPGRVKTRLCPPCTPAEAAQIAAAALQDTLGIAEELAVVRRILVLDGRYPVPGGWERVPQRGDGLGERLANAFADTARPGLPSLLIGMDTPQVDAGLLRRAAVSLREHGAVLGPAEDGGWWALGLGDPDAAAVLSEVPMSTAGTGALTLAALHGRGVHPASLPGLRDVDTAADAVAVAALCEPGRRFPAIVARTIGGACVARPTGAAGAAVTRPAAAPGRADVAQAGAAGGRA